MTSDTSSRANPVAAAGTVAVEVSAAAAAAAAGQKRPRSQSHPGPIRRKERRVRIAHHASNVVVVAHVDESRSHQERLQSWYSSTEFAAAKTSVKRQCRTYRMSRRYSDCLTSAYNIACSQAEMDAASTAGPAAGHWNDRKPPPPNSAPPPDAAPAVPEESSSATASSAAAVGGDQQQQEQQQAQPTAPKNINNFYSNPLVQWVDGPRGLEGYSSRMHALRRHRHTQESRHAVFMEQARQNFQLCHSNQHHQEQVKERNVERLAQQAQRASQRARSFAALLGQADAAWAMQNQQQQQDHDDEDEDDDSDDEPLEQEEYGGDDGEPEPNQQHIMRHPPTPPLPYYRQTSFHRSAFSPYRPPTVMVLDQSDDVCKSHHHHQKFVVVGDNNQVVPYPPPRPPPLHVGHAAAAAAFIRDSSSCSASLLLNNSHHLHRDPEQPEMSSPWSFVPDSCTSSSSAALEQTATTGEPSNKGQYHHSSSSSAVFRDDCS